MAAPLDNEMVGLNGIIKKEEFIRIITKELESLGFENTVKCLEEESGISLYSPQAYLFRQQVLNGNWDGALVTLSTIGLTDEAIVKSASVLILEHKIWDLLKRENVIGALDTVKNQMVPRYISINDDLVRELILCISIPSLCKATVLPSQDMAAAVVRKDCLEKLEKMFTAEIMVPGKRLERLVEQALVVQKDACMFHNTLRSELSLYSDHECGRNQIPSVTLKTIGGHRTQVWFVEFSHNGRYLASSSSDGIAIIWKIDEGHEVILMHTLRGHQRAVVTIAWRPDDSQLLTCGLEETIRRWDVLSGQCLHVYQIAGVELISCGWFDNGERMVSGMINKNICLWDLAGNQLNTLTGQRTIKISDVAVLDYGRRLISTCRENTILLLDMDTGHESFIEEDQAITSFSLSNDNRFLLVNLVNEELHLWSITEDVKVVSKFKGHRRARFVIRSCFGGVEQAFVACGSEDAKVYIWNRRTGKLLAALAGHSETVNCVSWHPTNPYILASASDDSTIRIWGPR